MRMKLKSGGMSLIKKMKKFKLKRYKSEHNYLDCPNCKERYSLNEEERKSIIESLLSYNDVNEYWTEFYIKQLRYYEANKDK
jgi:hypothetical protein